MADQVKQAAPLYNETNRRQFGGDFRMRAALTRPDGSLMPMTQQTLIPTGPGDIINKLNPALEHAITAVELSNAPAAATQRLQIIDAGYRYCDFKDWDLSERYRQIWEEGADGKIVTDAGGNYALALMWCPKEVVDARHASYLIWSDEIEKTYEQKLEETIDKFDTMTGQKGLNSGQRLRDAIEQHMEKQEAFMRRR